MKQIKEKKEEEESGGMYQPSFGAGSLRAVFNIGFDENQQPDQIGERNLDNQQSFQTPTRHTSDGLLIQ